MVCWEERKGFREAEIDVVLSLLVKIWSQRSIPWLADCGHQAASKNHPDDISPFLFFFSSFLCASLLMVTVQFWKGGRTMSKYRFSFLWCSLEQLKVMPSLVWHRSVQCPSDELPEPSLHIPAEVLLTAGDRTEAGLYGSGLCCSNLCCGGTAVWYCFSLEVWALEGFLPHPHPPKNKLFYL